MTYYTFPDGRQINIEYCRAKLIALGYPAKLWTPDQLRAQIDSINAEATRVFAKTSFRR